MQQSSDRTTKVRSIGLHETLASTLEYQDYRNFVGVIKKAMVACENSGEVIHNHFVEATDMVKIGSGAKRSVYRMIDLRSYLSTSKILRAQ